MAYRASAVEPPQSIVYGPFAPAWRALALILVFAVVVTFSLASAEVSAEVRCWRDAPGAWPTCERSVRKLTSPEVVRVAPAVLRRSGPPGVELDALAFDGVTLMLPNNPPGPFTRFLDAPAQLRVHEREAPVNGGCWLLGVCLVLIAFLLPRALAGTLPRRLLVDRTQGNLVMGRGSIVAGERRIVPLAHIAGVRVEMLGDGFLDRLGGGRVVLDLTGGAVVAAIPYARPRARTHLATATALAVALGLDAPVVSTRHQLPTGPATVGRVLVAQLASAVLATVLVAVWFSRA